MTMLETRPTGSAVEREHRAWSWISSPCRALDHTFRLRVEPVDAAFRRTLQPMIAPFQGVALTAPASAGRYDLLVEENRGLPYTLRYNDQRVGSGRYPSDLTGIFAWHINRSTIERSIGQHVLLHAAAAVRGGITVILPADMESGKTTTVAGLLREGFEYVTDEAVAINPVTGWITPFPKTLSLDPGSWPLFPEARPLTPLPRVSQWQVPARQLGARDARGPVPPPRVIVFPKYVRGARTTVSPMSRGEAVRELARTSFEFPHYAGRNLATLGRVASRATAARLIIGSLDGAIRAIEALVSETLLEDL